MDESIFPFLTRYASPTDCIFVDKQQGKKKGRAAIIKGKVW